jgi:nucleotide-binding universal stress UspA family protein
LAILKSAKQYDVQMIVMGARGLKGIKRFFLGSVSQKVLMHGDCSVLIVR